jgi:diguanylate cyclase (GGDEF)-like protein/PAS domain S-box-containing protein
LAARLFGTRWRPVPAFGEREEPQTGYNGLSSLASSSAIHAVDFENMNLAAVLIPPSLDAKQALRLRRFGLAALSYVLATALVALASTFGMLPASAALEVAAAYLAINLGLYAVIRSGFNLRFEDPSLTRFQIVVAITVLMYIVYHMDDGRNIALFGCFIVFLFGIFSLRAREFAVVTLYTLAAYALVINLLMHLRPQAIHDVPLEWMTWLVLAGLLPCFTIVGGQFNTLRRKLRESEARFRSLTEMSSDFYWESDTEHRLTQRASADKKLSTVSVFRQGAQIGQRRWEIPYLSPDEAGWQAHRAALDTHRPFRDFELSRLGADGAERYISISGDPVFDESGAFKGYRGVGTDITARKQAEHALRDSAEKLRLFADNVPAMAVSWDENLRCRFANKVFTGFYGLVLEDIMGKHVREILGEEVYREIEGHLAQTLRGHPVTYQSTRKLPNGEPRYLEINLLPHIGDQGKILGCFAVTTDITEHKLAEERIQRVAHHDSLTGLANRLLFNDRLEQAISLAKRDSRQFALLYLDLDKFKPVNDTLGHSAGDELLQAVAARIRHQVRESDTVARVGGDEFTVILPDIAKREEAETVAKKIIAAIAAPFQIGSQMQSVDIGTSIGIAVYPADGRDADALVTAADAAMYSAKQVGSSFRFCEA